MTKEHFTRTALVSELKIESLEQELRNANDLLAAKKAGSFSVSQEEVETMYPAAAATSKLLKSGMTLTQVNLLTQSLLRSGTICRYGWDT